MTPADRCALALVGGFLASIGQIGWTPASWLAAPLLCFALCGADRRTALVCGTLHGLGDILDCAPAASFGGFLLLVMFTGLAAGRAFVAVSFVIVTERLPPRAHAAAFPFVYVIADTIAARVIGPFHTPLSLGSSQVDLLVLAQAAAVVGERGLTFLVVFVSVFVFEGARARSRSFLVAAVIVVVVWLAGGRASLARVGPPERYVETASIQGAVPSSLTVAARYDEDAARAIEAIYTEGTRAAARDGARLVLWPEGAVHSGGVAHNAFRRRLQALARELDVSLVVGTDIPQPGGRRWNGALIVAPDGTVDTVGKVGLVPLTEQEYERAPGRRVVTVGDLRLGVLICAESLTPPAAAELATAGAQALVVLANDSSVGRGHNDFIIASRARMRAIENRLAVVHVGQWARTLVSDAAGEVIGGNVGRGPAIVRFRLPIAAPTAAAEAAARPPPPHNGAP